MNVKVTLDEATHTYTDDKKQVYTSVTTVIGKYEKPFNKEFWAVWTALKEMGVRGIRPMPETDQIMISGRPFSLQQIYDDKALRMESKRLKMENKWADITERSCKRGNETHNYLEDSTNEIYNKKGQFQEVSSIKGEMKSSHLRTIKGDKDFELVGAELDIQKLENSSMKHRYPDVYQLIVNLVAKGYTLLAECRICIEEYLLAGTIDLLCVRRKEFIIVDWKTNKDEMKFESGYYQKVEVMRDGKKTFIKGNQWIVKDERMLFPLDTLQKCKGTIYSMQLSTYAWMMEYYGFTWLKSILVHIRRTDEQDYAPVFYPNLKYYKHEVTLMLNHHKKQLNAKNDGK